MASLTQVVLPWDSWMGSTLVEQTGVSAIQKVTYPSAAKFARSVRPCWM